MHQISMPSAISQFHPGPLTHAFGSLDTTLVFSQNHNASTVKTDAGHPEIHVEHRPPPRFEERSRNSEKRRRPPFRKNMPTLNYYNKDYLFVVLVLTVVEPYEEQLEYYESICTGVFVSPNVVLTLSQCVLANYYEHIVEVEPSYTTIYMKHGVVLRALRIYVHLEQSDIDYAVMIVESSELTEFPKLPDVDLDFALMKNSCVLAGFGNQNRMATSNFKVRSLRHREVSEVRCSQKGRVCLRIKQLKPCRGDQGSPLICGGAVYALYAPGRFVPPHRCIERYAAEFTPLFPSRRWIDQITSAPSLGWLSSPWYPLALCAAIMLVMLVIYQLLAELVIKPVARKYDRHLSEVSQSLDSQGAQERRPASVVTTTSADVDDDADQESQKFITGVFSWYR